ncbi:MULTISPECIES: YdeI/OmpD-associated family protein [Kocuria]|uniref:YdeI/OmpD-associated family protein n=1 Tax=Kocuria TaxID=57493 RepID=UPI001F6110AA|nr:MULTISPECIES: YdeI/OmpD-associated family protein [Kocuria]MCT2361652.1 YdeI/OmpD-associated family protein [Kocuria marina]MDT0120835.1 YdeI/OmpD-associated family protein [Kocuria sp. PD6]
MTNTTRTAASSAENATNVTDTQNENGAETAENPATIDGANTQSGLPGGVVHELPADLAEALALDPVTAELWRGLTPLGRNEFVCWVEDAQKPETRQRRIRRTEEEMHEGKRRPCCWPGCKHRERTGR